MQNSPNILFMYASLKVCSFVGVWVNTDIHVCRTASDRLSFHPSLQHSIIILHTDSVQCSESPQSACRSWCVNTHPRQPGGGGECFLSPHTHTRARPGSPCTGVKGPRRVGCQNTTLINTDVSLDDVSLLLKNRGEIKRNEEMRLYLLRFGLSALMNLSLSEHTHTSSSR